METKLIISHENDRPKVTYVVNGREIPIFPFGENLIATKVQLDDLAAALLNENDPLS